MMMLMTMMVVVKWISHCLLLTKWNTTISVIEAIERWLDGEVPLLVAILPRCVYHSQCAAVVPVAPVLGYVIYHKCLLASVRLCVSALAMQWICGLSVRWLGFKDDSGKIHPEFCWCNRIIGTYPERPEVGLLPRYKYGCAWRSS